MYNFEWIKCVDRLPEESGFYGTASSKMPWSGKRHYSWLHYSAKYKKWNHFDSQGEDFNGCIDDVEYFAVIPEVKEISQLEIAKQIIKNNIDSVDCGIYNTRNIVGDEMVTIFSENGLTIDICYVYSYFEVFGLSQKDFSELKKYYDELVGRT